VRQIAPGGPVTATHPDVTRYFITVQEAVQLVIQGDRCGPAWQRPRARHAEPVRIDDVARRPADEAPRKIDIVYTGLRPVPPVTPQAAPEFDPWAPDEDVLRELRGLTGYIKTAEAVVDLVSRTGGSHIS